MSTHSDAAFNRCHPVRQWSGSSSASLQLQATTRCWKGCRREAGGGKREADRGKRVAPSGKRGAGSRVIAAAILLVPALLFSQETAPTLPSHPQAGKFTLKGAKPMKRRYLLPSSTTTA